MSITVNQTANTNQWQTLFNAVNQMAALFTSNTVTCDASANGSVSIGNTYFLGIFATSNLVANTVRGGNNTVTSTLNVSSNVSLVNTAQINVGAFTVNASVLTLGNVTINTTALVVPTFSVTSSFTANNLVATSSISMANQDSWSSVNTSITTTSATTIDSWLLATYRSAEYSLSLSDFTGNNFQFAKLFVVTDGFGAYVTESSVLSNVAFITLSMTTNATHAILQGQTISSTNTTVKGVRLSINV